MPRLLLLLVGLPCLLLWLLRLLRPRLLHHWHLLLRLLLGLLRHRLLHPWRLLLGLLGLLRP